MNLSQLTETLDLPSEGEWMHGFVKELYPICRSITGDGLRETLRRIGDTIPLSVREVPTGTPVFDWNVPREWSIRKAWIKNPRGETIVDFRSLNLHVVQYSRPVHQRLPLSELKAHLHTLPEHPDWIPYRTSYYREDWGFCLSHRQFDRLEPGEYEVLIDAELKDGALSYGECYLSGELDDEILFSCHACHPSLANDNLSGISLVVKLASVLARVERKFSYRFLFIPGTIGSITWLARNEDTCSRIRHGLVVACVGDRGKLHYKRSRRDSAEIDRAVVKALDDRGEDYDVREFSPYGYDERQYCSPGFDLPVGSLTRTPHGQFEQYHTSADDISFVCPRALADSLAAYLSVVRILEFNERFESLNQKGEPQLGKRGLYRAVGGMADAGQFEMAMLWVLNLSDTRHSLLDIAEKSKLSFDIVERAAEMLVKHNLLRRVAA